MDNGITPVMPIGGSNGDWGNNSFFWVFALLLLGMGGFGGFGNNNFANAIGYENLATSNDTYETNKYQRLRDSVGWTYLRSGFCKDLGTSIRAVHAFIVS